jgi:Na+/proline symporter
VVFPDLPLASAEVGYAKLIVTLLPSGLLGLMLASLIAAFMSTVDTHINYGASFMVNDLYRRFWVRHASPVHYVRTAQVSTAIMLGIAVLCAYNMNSVGGAWYYMSMLTAGYGIVAVARWFWWRINAWSEISALLASLVGSTVLEPKIARLCGYWEAIRRIGWQCDLALSGQRYHMNVTLDKWQYRFCAVVLVCTATWLTVTFLTRPTSEHRLAAFCRKVRPFPHFWKPIAANHPDIDWNRNLARVAVQWVLGIVATFAFCFGMGHLLFLRLGLGLSLLACSAAAMYVLLRPSNRHTIGA